MSYLSDKTGRPKEEGGHNRLNISVNNFSFEALKKIKNKSKFIEEQIFAPLRKLDPAEASEYVWTFDICLKQATINAAEKGDFETVDTLNYLAAKVEPALKDARALCGAPPQNFKVKYLLQPNKSQPEELPVDKRGRWIKEKEGVWSRNLGSFRTKAEKDDALEHSKELLIGLELILCEGKKDSQRSLEVESFPTEKPTSKRPQKQSAFDFVKSSVYDVNQVKALVEEHLRTSSDSHPVYKKICEYRELRKNSRERLLQAKCSDEFVDFIIEGIIPFRGDTRAWANLEYERLTVENRRELDIVISKMLELNGIITKGIKEIEVSVIVAHEPLSGHCRVCRGNQMLEQD